MLWRLLFWTLYDSGFYFQVLFKKNLLTAAATDFEIEVVIKNWLKFASKRDGGRQKREQLKKIQNV